MRRVSGAGGSADRADLLTRRALHLRGVAAQKRRTFFLVHKPERLADLMVSLRENRLEPKRLRLVRHRAGGPVSLVLLEARLDGRPGLVFEPDLALFDENGAESEDHKRIYHHQEG